MRQTSVCCPSTEAEASAPARQGLASALYLSRLGGFTLLEMLVVLALMALAVGIVAPRAVGWLDAARERGWRDDFRAYLEALPVRTFLAGEPRRFEAKELLESVPGAPTGVEVRLPQPLSYNAQGVASGGTVELRRSGFKETWRVEPITGRVSEGG